MGEFPQSRQALINLAFLQPPSCAGMRCHFQPPEWLKMKKNKSRIFIFHALKIPQWNASELP